MTINEISKKLGVDPQDLAQEMFDTDNPYILTPYDFEYSGYLTTDFGKKDIKINWSRKKVDMSSWLDDETAIWFFEQQMDEIEYDYDYLESTPREVYQRLKKSIKHAEKVLEEKFGL